MALGDVDGDGTLELFVGAKILPGQYPLAGSSAIYRRDQGRWVADQSLSEPLQDLGMIRAALWLDIDQDGFPELILSREWDSPLLFKNQQGRLVDQTQIMGLADAKGCWVDWPRVISMKMVVSTGLRATGVSTGPMPSTCTIHWFSTMVF